MAPFEMADETETRRIEFQTNKELVFAAPRPRRMRLPSRLIFGGSPT